MISTNLGLCANVSAQLPSQPARRAQEQGERGGAHRGDQQANLQLTELEKCNLNLIWDRLEVFAR